MPSYYIVCLVRLQPAPLSSRESSLNISEIIMQISRIDRSTPHPSHPSFISPIQVPRSSFLITTKEKRKIFLLCDALPHRSANKRARSGTAIWNCARWYRANFQNSQNIVALEMLSDLNLWRSVLECQTDICHTFFSIISMQIKMHVRSLLFYYLQQT